MPKFGDYTEDTAPDGADLILIKDVGAGTTDKVTLTNLAASTAFAGQYGSEIWVPAWQLAPASGVPAPALNRTFGSRWQSLTFADAATQTAAVAVLIPDTWTTFDIALYWSVSTADTGNVRWQVNRDRAASGESLNVSGSNTAATAATPGQFLLGVTLCGTGVSAETTKLLNLRVQRIGADAADTLTGSAGADLLGVLISRAS